MKRSSLGVWTSLVLAWSIAGCGGPPAPKAPQSPKASAAAAPSQKHTPFLPDSPLGIELTEEMIPKDNPITLAKIELGRQLYFDPRLSQNLTVSCASCHNPSLGWADGFAVSSGIHGQKGGRSAPTVMNRALAGPQFWDGRAASLEEQAVGPIGNAIEMGFTVEEAVKRLNSIPSYRTQFEEIFGSPATAENLGKALATFERTVLVGGAPNDYYEAYSRYLDEETGELLPPYEDDTKEDLARRTEAIEGYKANPLSEEALRGRKVYFGKGQCSLCHVGPNLSDEQYHNLGVGMKAEKPDWGRYEVSKKEEDRGAFRTPTLRNIKDSGPYMHDGSQRTLKEVVQFYNQGGHANRWLSPKIQPLKLTEQEQSDLVAFMEQGLQGKVADFSIHTSKLD